MKSPSLAFILSFVLPGAGLAYLGRWTWAFLNLAAVIGVGITCVAFLTEAVFLKYVHTIAIALSCASGGLAYGMTQFRNLHKGEPQ